MYLIWILCGSACRKLCKNLHHFAYFWTGAVIQLIKLFTELIIAGRRGERGGVRRGERERERERDEKQKETEGWTLTDKQVHFKRFCIHEMRGNKDRRERSKYGS